MFGISVVDDGGCVDSFVNVHEAFHTYLSVLQPHLVCSDMQWFHRAPADSWTS